MYFMVPVSTPKRRRRLGMPGADVRPARWT